MNTYFFKCWRKSSDKTFWFDNEITGILHFWNKYNASISSFVIAIDGDEENDSTKFNPNIPEPFLSKSELTLFPIMN